MICTSIHASQHVHIIVSDYSHHDVGSRDTFSSLSCFKHASVLDLLVNVVFADTAIWKIIMGNVVDVLSLEPSHLKDPGTRADDLIGPAAVLNHGNALILIHDDLALLFYGFLVTGDTHDQVDMLEGLLGLFKDLGVADVEHVKDTICVDSYWVVGIIAIRYIG